ncbi:hypothetical protein EMMF5_004992 [Cystobasidiomycetes sp. EMM_F5]
MQHQQSPPRQQGSLTTEALLLIILAVLFPPLTAAITDGCGGQFWLNLLLTFLGYFPGVIHAIWLVLRRDRKPQTLKNQQHYVYVQQTPQQQPVLQQPQPGYEQHPAGGYAPPQQQTAAAYPTHSHKAL